MAKTVSRPQTLFKVVVTRIVSEHATRREALAALARLKPVPRALGVVIEVPNKKGK